MSTKIHHGYRVSVTDLFAAVADAREQIEPVQQDLILREAVAEATFIVDRHRHRIEEELWGPDAAENPLRFAEINLHYANHEIRRTKRRNPTRDFSFEVCFLPDPATDDTFALVYTEQAALVEAWQALGWVEPWPYWNNTDRPSDLTDSEWSQRSEVWERVLPWAKTPAELGLVWTSGSENGPIDFDLVDAEMVPSRKRRARHLAAHTPAPPGVSERPSVSELLERLERVAAAIEPTLADITVDDLRGSA